MNTLFVLDIDATLADATSRIRKAGPEPRREGNAEAYNAWLHKVQNHISLMQDSPVPGMRDVANALANWGPTIYVTAREEAYREVTRAWLDMHQFPLSELIMRPTGNLDESGTLKEKLVKLALPLYRCEEVVVIDDDGRGCIEEACKRNGWTLLKSRSGGQV